MLAAFTACVLCACAEGEQKAITVEPGFVELGNDYAGLDVQWLPQQPVSLPYRELYRKQGEVYQEVCLLHLSRPGEYIIAAFVADHDAAESRIDRWTITVAGEPPDPEPDPGPDPDPPGPGPEPAVTVKVRQLARTIPNAARNKLATVFTDVAALMHPDADTNIRITDVVVAMRHIRERTEAIELPASAKPLVDYLSEYFQKNVDKDVKAARTAFGEVAKGLRVNDRT